jgi:hypothetical protein
MKMTRPMYNALYWPAVTFMFIAWLMSKKPEQFMSDTVWGVMYLQWMVACMYLIWFRLRHTTVTSWVTLLTLLPFGLPVIGIMTCFLPDRRNK